MKKDTVHEITWYKRKGISLHPSTVFSRPSRVCDERHRDTEYIYLIATKALRYLKEEVQNRTT